MTAPRTVLPDNASSDVSAELRRLGSTAPKDPFDAVTIEFCARLSHALLQRPEARSYPELTALGFWMRPAELTRMKAEFGALETAETILVPRGLVFHIPPANVDTIFIYSWVLSLLAGNKNVVRIPGTTTEVTTAIVGVLGQLMAEAEFAEVAQRNWFLQYGHDSSVTAALSRACSLRVIWGGDSTVNTIRESPIPPHARDLTFPDRRSVAVLAAETVSRLGPEEIAKLADRLYNDAYWFDQLGCSSPTVIFWVGTGETPAAASRALMSALADVVSRRGYRVEPAMVMRKLVHAYDAVMSEADIGAHDYGAGLSVLELNPDQPAAPRACGGGLFHQIAVAELSGVTPWIDRRVQTVGHFGLDTAALASWAKSLRGQGVDRIVPVGEALSFGRYWDGHDLFQEFSRRVFVQGAGRHI